MAAQDRLLSTPVGWQRALDELPPRNDGHSPIPAFFFAHGHPGIIYNMNNPGRQGLQGVDGPLNKFLKDFGPALINKYNPKAIVVFSAHWETTGQTLVTDYGDDQPLLYDYYGFPEHFYAAKWHSNGSTALSDQIIDSLTKAGIPARKTTRAEPRGEDGLTGPAPGLDHGVFIPFILMFPEAIKKAFHIPVVQVSIEGSLDPTQNMKLGQAVSSLRNQGILILSGGLTIHTFRDLSAWDEKTASDPIKKFESAIVEAALKKDTKERFQSLKDLKKLQGFRLAHPREEHFAPIWIAAGAGSDQGQTRIITDIHGCKTIAFGVI